MKKLCLFIPKLSQNLAARRVQSAANRFPRRGSYKSILALFREIDFRQLSIPPGGQILRQFWYSFVIMASACLDVFAAPIHSYQELTSAMREGNRFVFLLDLQECTGNPSMPIGYLIPTTMMLLPATQTASERVATSFLQFTDHSGNPTYEYVKFTLNSDDSVVVRTTFYDPKSFQPIGPVHTVNCSMGKGLEIFSECAP